MDKAIVIIPNNFIVEDYFYVCTVCLFACLFVCGITQKDEICNAGRHCSSLELINF